MGASGADVLLSEHGFQCFPYDVECKNRAAFAIYKDFDQARSHGSGTPLLVIKQNHSEPLAVITLEHFMELCKSSNQTEL